jgi:plasmid stabilization system protein ParE
MAYQVRVTARAERDAEAAIRYLRRHSRATAWRWHAALLEAVRSLEGQPERCGLAPEAEELAIELRQLLFGKRRHVYRLLFTIAGNTVNVLHIRHATRRPLQPGDL